MATGTPATAKGVAFLATHPELISGAYTVRADKYDAVSIQGEAEYMTDAVAALRELDANAPAPSDWHEDSAGGTYERVVAHVDDITVELVLVTQAVQS